MIYRLRYFASLADSAGCGEENVASEAQTPRALYPELAARHEFRIAMDRLRVAVNGALVDWEHKLADNDEIVFLPPVSGG